MELHDGAPRRVAEALAVAAPSEPGLLRWRDVADLAATSGYPCISVLLPTSPGPRMTERDAAQLAGLVSGVRSHLEHLGLLSSSRLLADLEALASDVRAQPTDQGLALFVSRAVRRALVLPVTVRARAIVEPTFATRDLVRALHRTPPHLLVMLHPGCAHVHEAQAGTLRLRTTVTMASRTAAAEAGTPDRTEAFLREVDHAVAEARRRFPGPVVVASTPTLWALFSRHARLLDGLAGVVDVRDAPTLLEVQQQAALVLERYLLSRQREALGLVARVHSESPQRLVSGIEGAWLAARHERPVLLAVEHGLTVPGHHSGSPLTPRSADPHAPERVDDLVDDLIEIVVQRGGWVALVDDGALAEHMRIALVLR